MTSLAVVDPARSRSQLCCPCSQLLPVVGDRSTGETPRSRRKTRGAVADDARDGKLTDRKPSCDVCKDASLLRRSAFANCTRGRTDLSAPLACKFVSPVQCTFSCRSSEQQHHSASVECTSPSCPARSVARSAAETRLHQQHTIDNFGSNKAWPSKLQRALDTDSAHFTWHRSF